MNKNVLEQLEKQVKKEENKVLDRDTRFCWKNPDVICDKTCAIFFIEKRDGSGKCSFLKIAIVINAIAFKLGVFEKSESKE